MSEDFTYLENLILNRKVVRNYKKIEFDPEKLKNISKFSVKIPTAGFSRGIEILQVTNKQNIKNIAEHFNVQSDIVFSSMDQPLGQYAGLWCEIKEAIYCLRNEGSNDTMKVTFTLGSKLLQQAKIVSNENDAFC